MCREGGAAIILVRLVFVQLVSYLVQTQIVDNKFMEWERTKILLIDVAELRVL